MTTAKRRTESRVNKYSVINIDQNKYSVPDYLVGKFVKVKIYPEEIKIYYKESKTAEHILKTFRIKLGQEERKLWQIWIKV
ncbi:MAG: Mu transposase domain-containing protein [Anaerococcus sp.]